MDEQKNKRKAYLTMTLWIAVIVLDAAAVTVLAILGKLQAEVLVAAIVISAFIAVIVVLALIRTYKDHIKPSLRDEKTGDSTYELRVEKMKRRRKGRDMFEVCDNFRSQYFTTMYIVIGIFSLLLPFAFILKLNEYERFHIPFWWAFVAAAVIMVISVIAGRKSDFVFYTSMNLKFEIKKNGYDPFYVNTDFMMATYHDLIKGFMAIGQSYYVIFSQKFVRVREMNDVVKVQRYAREYKINAQTMTRHFVNVIEKDNSKTHIACADELAAVLILDEFRKQGIETEVLPVERARK